MASFKIGRIKGERGEKGESGAKGERGERGESGKNGTDGYTPCFAVGEIETLTAGSDAYVKIDASDAKNPIISFGIPRGENGASAQGDMAKSIYDKNGKNADIYEYADTLSKDCIKKSGGGFTGEVTAVSGEKEKLAVRNICLCSSPPTGAKNGDICIADVKNEESTLFLKDTTPGAIVLIEENGEDTEYIVCEKNYHKDNTVTLIRKYLLPCVCAYDRANRPPYAFSTSDMVLSTMFILCYGNYVKGLLENAEIESGVLRKVFLPSKNELEQMTYFLTNAKNTSVAQDTDVSTYLTRTRYASNQANAYAVIAGNETVGVVQGTEAYRLRPMIVLPEDTPVANAQTPSGAGFKLSEPKGGIYLFNAGMWEEVLHGYG